MARAEGQGAREVRPDPTGVASGDARGRIGSQIVLPLSKAIEISLKSLRIRFWRSLVTMGGIVLAMAFLSYTWTSRAILEPLSRAPTMTASPAGETSGEVEPKGSVTRSWLVLLSLLVAVIGVVNAMLMAVTERFREIGTMKCLGALDSFIVKLFLLESSFQGAAGTLIGIVLGTLLACALAVATHGAGAVFAAFPVADVAIHMGYALGIGVVLSVLGAIYPALVAARMEPVAALRQEF
ncbi:MAG: ABC transporter permease [Planctomycetota bacterium]|jgi:hypothetical protein